MFIPVLLAGAGTVNAENAIHSLIPSGSTLSQAVIYGGVFFAVALGGIVWALAFHGRRHRRHSHHHRSRSMTRHNPPSPAASSPRTLAEMGGLPPIRSGHQPPSPA